MNTTQIETINDQINNAITAMHAATPKAKVRRISTGDYTGTLQDAISQATPAEDRLVLREVGGYVANSYGSAASGDRLDVVINLATGEAVVSAVRCQSPSAPYGNGKCLTVQLVRAGKVRGRYV